MNHWEADGSGKRNRATAWVAGVIGICLVSVVLILYMVTQFIGAGEAATDPDKVASSDAGKQKESVADTSKKVDPEPADTDSGSNKKASIEPETPANPADNGAKDDPEKSTDNNNPPENVEEPNGPDDNSPDPVLNEDAALQNTDDALTMPAVDEQDSILDDFKDIGELVFESGLDMDEFREVASDDQTHKYGIGKVFVAVPRALTVVPSAAMEEVYPGLAFKDQSLLDFSRNLFGITRIPVQLDSQAIARGQLDPLALINASGKDITVQQVLEQAIEPLGLAWQWNTDETVVIITTKPDEEVVVAEVPLDPALAVTDEETAKPLILELQTIVEPGSWNTNGGAGSMRFADGKLTIEQTSLITTRVRNLIDRLVLAARLKANPDDIDSAAGLATVYSQTRDLLGSEGTVLSIQAEPIQQMLRKLQREDGLTLIVNWTEASQNAWNPQVNIPWKSNGNTLEVTLRDLTNSMGLAYRLLDNEIIEVTSKQSFWNTTRIEVYPCHRQLAKNYSPNQIVQFLKEGIAADLPNQEYTRVDFLPQYGCVVALLPDPLHIRAERILEQLAGSR